MDIAASEGRRVSFSCRFYSIFPYSKHFVGLKRQASYGRGSASRRYEKENDSLCHVSHTHELIMGKVIIVHPYSMEVVNQT